MVGILETLVKAGAVFGLLALTVQLLRRIDGGSRSRQGRGRKGTGRRRLGGGRMLEVVERTGVGRTATVVVVRVAEEHWVLGVTDAGITRLGEVDLDDGMKLGTFDDTDGAEGDLGAETGEGELAAGQRHGAVVDLRHRAAPALAWAERVRALRDRLPEREHAEDVTIPAVPAAPAAPATPTASPADEVSA